MTLLAGLMKLMVLLARFMRISSGLGLWDLLSGPGLTENGSLAGFDGEWVLAGLTVEGALRAGLTAEKTFWARFNGGRC